MGTSAAKLDLRVFIDGYEIPAISVGASFQENGPAAAQIELVPTDAFFKIQPRALVCVFYMHSGYEVTDRKQYRGFAIDQEYKLLFVGEYAGYQYNKTTTGRQIALTCVDLTNYLDAIKQHAVNYKADGLAMTENALLGVQFDRSKRTTLGKDISESITNWMAASKVGKEVSPSLGIQRIIRESFFTSNLFWSVAYNRVRVGDTIAALPEDKSSAELFNFKAFKNYVKLAISQRGSLVSMNDVLATIAAPVLYNSTSIPCPIYDKSGSMVGMTREQIDATSLKDVIKNRDTNDGLYCTVWKPDFWFLTPPACNVIFPDQYSSLSFGRNMLAEPTRLHLRTELQMKRHTYIKRPAEYNPWMFNLLTGPVQQSPVQYGVTAGAFYLRDRTFAPNFESFKSLLEKPSKGGGYKARLHEVLLPHEKFLGPNTIMVNEGAFSRYATQKERRKYYGFYADYLFWKYYYGGRAGTINMKFNPNIVPGFSCVIFDKADAENPIHYIGFVISVSHSINQGGGGTTAQVVAMRPYTENIDFDGTGRDYQSVIMDSAGKFLDERYSSAYIGEAFYRKILGCGSLIDLSLDILGEEDFIELINSPTDAITAINSKYLDLVKSGASLHENIAVLTARKGKAHIVDLFGTDDQGFVNLESDVSDISVHNVGEEVTGFFRDAIDADYANFNYTSKTSTQGTKTVTTPSKVFVDFDRMIYDPIYYSDAADGKSVQHFLVNYEGNSTAFYQSIKNLVIPRERWVKNGSAVDFQAQQRSINAEFLIQKYVIIEDGETKKVKTTSTKTVDKDYDGGSLVNERHSAIKEYLDTLVYRGIKS